jgi:hypothetical protein
MFICSPDGSHVRNGRITDHLGVFRRGSAREEFFADEALAHALPDDEEHLADLINACGARASLFFVVGSHRL